MIVWPGLRRSVSAISRLFNSASFVAPLTHTAVPTRAATGTTATFTRATAKTWPNNDGFMVTGLAGEIGFVGARRVDNLIRLGAAQSSTLAVAANVTMTLPAGAYQFSMGAGTGTATFSGTGGATGTLAASASARTFVAKTISAGTLIVTASVATLVDIQVVSMVAETDQTTEREYVSVGALDYRSELNRLYLSLPGTAGRYASTPDSVLGSNSPDKIEAKIALVDWSPAVGNIIAGKRSGAGQITAVFYVAVGGALSLFASLDGTASSINVNSTDNVSFPDLQDGYVKYERNESTGVIKFFTSSDGSAWTQLGADVAAAAGALYASTSPWEIGSQLGGTSSNLNGKIYWVTGYSSSTPIFDFNPHRDAVTPTGTFTSSTTGEVWTINGASSVVRSDYYHGSFVDGVKCFGTDISGNPIPLSTLKGYLAEGARTNLCLQSNAFNTTWTKDATLTLAQNAIGPDGATSAWTLTDASAIGGSYITQDITLTAASYTMSVFVKKTVGAQASYPVVLFYLAATTGLAGVTIDTSNGIATAWTAYTGFTGITGSATCVSHNSDYWGVSLTFTGTAAAWTLRLYPAGTTNATQSTGTLDLTAQGSAVFANAQVELGSFASSYIPTTTVAVARNADVLTYSGGNIPNIKTLMATFRREVWVSNDGYIAALTNGTLNELAASYMNTATQHRFNGIDGAAGQWDTISSNAYVPGASSTVAWSAATNDVKMAKDGVAQTADTGATMPTVTQLEIGCVTGAFQLNGTVGGVYGWTRNLSQSELNAITAL